MLLWDPSMTSWLCSCARMSLTKVTSLLMSFVSHFNSWWGQISEIDQREHVQFWLVLALLLKVMSLKRPKARVRMSPCLYHMNHYRMMKSFACIFWASIHAIPSFLTIFKCGQFEWRMMQHRHSTLCLNLTLFWLLWLHEVCWNSRGNSAECSADKVLTTWLYQNASSSVLPRTWCEGIASWLHQSTNINSTCCSSDAPMVLRGAPRYMHFYRQYTNKWAKILRFTPPSSHAACDDCLEFKELFKMAKVPWSKRKREKAQWHYDLVTNRIRLFITFAFMPPCHM